MAMKSGPSNKGTKCHACGFENIKGTDRCVECQNSLMQRDLPKPTKSDKFQHTMMTAPISELKTEHAVLVASQNDTVQKIVRTLQDEGQQCVVVYDQKKLVGIVSLRDLLLKATEHAKDLSKVKVKSVMTANPEFVRAHDPITFAVNKMAMGGFRHVPVIADDGSPISVISINDVLTYLSQK